MVVWTKVPAEAGMSGENILILTNNREKSQITKMDKQEMSARFMSNVS